ncbi:c-type cytochrome [Beggiatoa leptomitoformis]|uniref:Cytochrome C n=1 Tax=Beggiatoa leptomitoformis TaxID=288004 RepID=A0A2N9YBQ2_9GAMM|nr:c-type cytochrome [Beggiatoa leptomitoformis]ALG69293.2 cytochrome C [Beggiatoa leptomitoformis]AUI67862.2 cytochrome C [Beggiatoa leptomitoformis]
MNTSIICLGSVLQMSIGKQMIFSMGLFLFTPALLAVPSSLEIQANTCNVCHGEEGLSQGSVPSLKAKPIAYLEQVLLAFKADKQVGTIMNRVAKGFTDEELTAIAHYYAELK